MSKDYSPSSPGATQPKTERNKLIAARLDADPDLTFDDLAAEYNLSRQRIQQLYFRHTGKSHRKPPRTTTTCPTCGTTYPRDLPYADHLAAAGHGPGEFQYKRNREWVELYADGISTTQIARMYGVQVSAVWTVLNKQYGIKMRPQGHKGGVVVRRKHLTDGG